MHKQLTQQDAPVLRQLLAEWGSMFTFKLSQPQLIIWAERFSPEIISKSIVITRDWVARAQPAPSVTHIYNYANSCMRNIDASAKDEARAGRLARRLLGGAQ
jgi:hypothetical protein